MSFRKYGGLNYAANNNIVRSHYSNSDNLTISSNIGLSNTKIISDSNLDINNNSFMNIFSLIFSDGSVQTTAFQSENDTNPSFNNLTVGTLVVLNDFTVDGNTILQGSLTTNGITNLNNNCTITKNCTIKNNCTINNTLFLNSTLDFTNNGGSGTGTIIGNVNFNTGNVNFNTGLINILNTTDTNTTLFNSGALVVSGGVGIAKNMFIGGGNIYTISSSGSLYPTTNNIIIGNISSTGTTSIRQTTDTNTTLFNSGALVVSGGVGIAKNMFIGGGNIYTSSTTGYLYPTTNNIIIGNISSTGTTSIQQTTNATSTTNAALVVSGGIAAGLDMNIGGNMSIGGIIIANTNTTGTSNISNLNVINLNTVNIITNNLTVSDDTFFQNVELSNLIVNGSVDSSSNNTGSIIVNGGIGMGKNLYVGGGNIKTINSIGNLFTTTNVINIGAKTFSSTIYASNMTLKNSDFTIDSSNALVSYKNPISSTSITNTNTSNSINDYIYFLYTPDSSYNAADSSYNGTLNVPLGVKELYFLLVGTGGTGGQGDLYSGGGGAGGILYGKITPDKEVDLKISVGKNTIVYANQNSSGSNADFKLVTYSGSDGSGNYFLSPANGGPGGSYGITYYDSSLNKYSSVNTSSFHITDISGSSKMEGFGLQGAKGGSAYYYNHLYYGENGFDASSIPFYDGTSAILGGGGGAGNVEAFISSSTALNPSGTTFGGKNGGGNGATVDTSYSGAGYNASYYGAGGGGGCNGQIGGNGCKGFALFYFINPATEGVELNVVGDISANSATIEQLIITGYSDASSSNTGALVVSGGIGINKNVNIGGNIYLNGAYINTISTNGYLYSSTNNIYFGPRYYFSRTRASNIVMKNVYYDISASVVPTRHNPFTTTSMLNDPYLYYLYDLSSGFIIIPPETPIVYYCIISPGGSGALGKNGTYGGGGGGGGSIASGYCVLDLSSSLTINVTPGLPSLPINDVSYGTPSMIHSSLFDISSNPGKNGSISGYPSYGQGGQGGQGGTIRDPSNIIHNTFYNGGNGGYGIDSPNFYIGQNGFAGPNIPFADGINCIFSGGGGGGSYDLSSSFYTDPSNNTGSGGAGGGGNGANSEFAATSGQLYGGGGGGNYETFQGGLGGNGVVLIYFKDPNINPGSVLDVTGYVSVTTNGINNAITIKENVNDTSFNMIQDFSSGSLQMTSYSDTKIGGFQYYANDNDTNYTSNLLFSLSYKNGAYFYVPITTSTIISDQYYNISKNNSNAYFHCPASSSTSIKQYDNDGSYNVVMGYASGQNVNGSYNVVLGSYTGLNDISCCTLVGSGTNSDIKGYVNSTALGYNAQITESNQLVLGDASLCNIYTNGTLNISNLSTTASQNLLKLNSANTGYNIGNTLNMNLYCGDGSYNSLTKLGDNMITWSDGGIPVENINLSLCTCKYETTYFYQNKNAGLTIAPYNTTTGLTTGGIRIDNSGCYINGGTITINGSLSINGSLYGSSDYRIKENIEGLTNETNIDNLKPVKYTLKETPEEVGYGFLAHELQEVFPSLVKGEKDGEKIQTINYIGLISILVSEIQELKKRVSFLENK